MAAAQRYVLSQQPYLAIEAYRAALLEDPASADALNGLGAIYVQLSRVYEARESFAEAARLRPADAYSQLMTGLTALSTRQVDLAASSLERLTRLEPRFGGGFYALGIAYGLQDDWPGCIDALSRAVRYSPDNAQCRYKLAVAYLLAGDEKNGRQEIEALKELDHLV